MLEITLRIIGLGFYDYFRKIWNTYVYVHTINITLAYNGLVY